MSQYTYIGGYYTAAKRLGSKKPVKKAAKKKAAKKAAKKKAVK